MTADEKLTDVGRGMRMMMLTTSSVAFDVQPTQEFPRVYGVLMDFPIDDNHIATVFSASSGAASLYTTSTFGIIGGEAHENVCAAAKTFVRAADAFHDDSAPATDFPYPKRDRVRFYFLTFRGVRFIDTDLNSLTAGTDRYSTLFDLGQEVLTELRLVAEEDSAR